MMLPRSLFAFYRLPLIGTALMVFLFRCQPSMPEEVVIAYEKLPKEVDFNIHIKSVLSDRCYQCHGPDEHARKANLRFDNKDGLFAKAESGNYAFVLGNLSRSEAIKRILSNDPEYIMPSPKSNHTLNADEKAAIIKWVEQGAEWKEHWSFIPPEQGTIPEETECWFTKNEIDLFYSGKIKKQRFVPLTRG